MFTVSFDMFESTLTFFPKFWLSVPLGIFARVSYRYLTCGCPCQLLWLWLALGLNKLSHCVTPSTWLLDCIYCISACILEITVINCFISLHLMLLLNSTVSWGTTPTCLRNDFWETCTGTELRVYQTSTKYYSCQSYACTYSHIGEL